MMEGMTHGNLAAYRQSERMARLSAQQKFQYDWEQQYWRRDGTDKIIGFNWDNWLADDNAFTYDANKVGIF